MDESHEATPARKRGRPRKSDGGQGIVKTDEAEISLLPSTGKRKMVEAVLDSDNLKRPCNARNGMCKRHSFVELLRVLTRLPSWRDAHVYTLFPPF